MSRAAYMKAYRRTRRGTFEWWAKETARNSRFLHAARFTFPIDPAQLTPELYEIDICQGFGCCYQSDAGDRSLAVDHYHRRKRYNVRGRLCSRCNTLQSYVDEGRIPWSIGPWRHRPELNFALIDFQYSCGRVA